MRSTLLHVFAWLVLVGITGCSDGSIPTYQVTGSVKMTNGVPLAGGRVEFKLVDNSHQMISRGYVMSDGSFTLSTFQMGDGAPAGKHRVLVAPPIPKGDHDVNPRARSIIDPKYLNYETSGLECEVTEDYRKNVFDLQVEPR